MYLSACSCNSLAEYLASWKSESASSRSPLPMPSRPLVFASMKDGVNSCSTTARQQGSHNRSQDLDHTTTGDCNTHAGGGNACRIS